MLRRSLPVFALTLSLLHGCGDSPDTFDASVIDAAPNAGTFSLAWSIVDNGATLPCTDVGAVAVAITLIRQGAAGGEAESFPCTSGQATSRPFAPGVYDFSVDIRASGSRSLIDTPVRITGIEITANADSPLPAQEFAIEAVGSFSFVVDAGAAGGNCAANAADGAGLVGLSFALTDGTGTCVPAAFVIADGSEAGGTYTSDCTTPPAPFPCIGSDQTVTVSDFASGPLSLEIIGQKDGPIDCYGRITNFDLPGANLLKDLGALLLSLEFSPECDPNFTFPDGGIIDAGLPDAAL